MRASPSTRTVAALIAALGLLAGAVCASAGGAMPARARAAYEAYERGEVDRALLESAQAVQEQALSSAAWAVRGYILSRSGDKDGAEQAYRESVRLDPADPVARNNLGAVLLALGRPQDAKLSFENALALDPFYADARNNLGAAYERLGQLPQAQRSYRMATVMDPRHAEAHNNLGTVQLKAGDVRGASASFARAAALDPDFDAPALNLALVGQRGEGDDAFLARLEEAAGRPGASPRLKARVLALKAAREVAAHRWAPARELYLEALALSPRDTTLLNNVAVVEDQLGMDREALLHLTEALDLDPQLKIAQNNIGIVHTHRGQLDLAESVFQDLIARDPQFHRAHYNLGVIRAARGDLAGARASFREAARLAPRDAAVRYNLAVLSRQETGDLRAEMRAYESVLRLDPELAEVHLALGMLLADPATPAELRDPARARRLLERFLDLAAPSDAEGRQEAEDWLAWLATEEG